VVLKLDRTACARPQNRNTRAVTNIYKHFFSYSKHFLFFYLVKNLHRDFLAVE